MMTVDLTSRQRGSTMTSVARACDDDKCCQHLHHQNGPLAESSVSTDAEQDQKYNKQRRRIKKQQQRKGKNKNKKSPTTIEIISVFAIFVVVLLLYHVLVKQKRDRRRHAKLLYDRAQNILENLDRNNQHHTVRRQHDHHGDHGLAGYGGERQFSPPRGYPQQQQPQKGGEGFAVRAPPDYPPRPQQQQGFSNREDDDEQQQRQHDEEPLANHAVEDAFAQHRLLPQSAPSVVPRILKDWIRRWDEDIRSNVHGGIRWIRPYLLPGMDDLDDDPRENKRQNKRQRAPIFEAKRAEQRMAWHEEWDQMVKEYGGAENIPGPPVDYTDPDKYRYPPVLEEPPAEGGYPQMTSLGDMMQAWDQDEDNEGIINEALIHFDYSNPRELAMAERFRDAMLPFKLYNVPELSRATELWTDEYVAKGFGVDQSFWDSTPKAHGTCQESVDHYFAFFTPPLWKPERMGVPPVRNSDLNFAQWAQHARYADAARLAADQPHYYWQSGADKMERYEQPDQWSFITKDLPSFSATEPNFIMFHPEEQKGIQCRFGERGVVAATHYDSGRNMVGMITGAKRYILSPPTACGKLGIFPDKKSPIFRHSLLNFGHIKYLNDPEKSHGMSDEEREWLERAATASSVETVLKAGEVLYIPSFWFHYIVSVQKSAQCNARSGIQLDRHWEFGGAQDVQECPVE